MCTGCWVLGTCYGRLWYEYSNKVSQREALSSQLPYKQVYRILIKATIKDTITIRQQMITIVLLGPVVFECLLFNKAVKSM